jgi:hypothetical protein
MVAPSQYPVPSAPPGRATVELVLSAAADVVFSDGVSPAFLAQWVDETCLLLSLVPAGPVALARPGGDRHVYDARLPPE